MKVLVDENIKKSVYNLLLDLGIDAKSINYIKKGISDDEVLAIALAEHRVLITNDRKFVKKCKNINHWGIIWLRSDSKYHDDIIKKFIPKIKDQDLSNKIYILTKDKYTVESQRKSYLLPVKRSYSY